MEIKSIETTEGPRQHQRRAHSGPIAVAAAQRHTIEAVAPNGRPIRIAYEKMGADLFETTYRGEHVRKGNLDELARTLDKIEKEHLAKKAEKAWKAAVTQEPVEAVMVAWAGSAGWHPAEPPIIRRRIELWQVRYRHAAPHVNEDGNLTFASTDDERAILTIVEEKSDDSCTAHLRIESRTLILGRPMTRFDGSWRL